MNQKKKNHGTKGQTSFLLLHFLQGALIGLGAVLPGISGGVLSVVFGVYQPIMELLSHPRSAMKRYYRMLIPTKPFVRWMKYLSHQWRRLQAALAEALDLWW